jgi:tetratricopeptide (TPR) repeat protein
MTRVSALSVALFALLTALGCAGATKAPPRSLREVPAEQLFTRGLQLADLGEHVPAEQFFQAARARGYDEAEVVKQLVKVCLAGSRFDSALSYAGPYLERHPEAWPLRQVVAAIYMAVGNGPAARNELEVLLDQKPDHSESHYFLGIVMRDEYHDAGSARTSFERYLALAPRGRHASEARAYVARAQRSVPVPVEPAIEAAEPAAEAVQ